MELNKRQKRILSIYRRAPQMIQKQMLERITNNFTHERNNCEVTEILLEIWNASKPKIKEDNLEKFVKEMHSFENLKHLIDSLPKDSQEIAIKNVSDNSFLRLYELVLPSVQNASFERLKKLSKIKDYDRRILNIIMEAPYEVRKNNFDWIYDNYK